MSGSDPLRRKNQFEMACLSGPLGGSFGFWDVGATNPSISLAPGQRSTNLWRLTEADGTPGSDPYGHIHGRRFTATVSGGNDAFAEVVDDLATSEQGYYRMAGTPSIP